VYQDVLDHVITPSIKVLSRILYFVPSVC